MFKNCFPAAVCSTSREIWLRWTWRNGPR